MAHVVDISGCIPKHTLMAASDLLLIQMHKAAGALLSSQEVFYWLI